MKRREFINTIAAGTAGLTLSGPLSLFGKAPYIRKSDAIDKVIVLGIDGMDPNLLSRFVREGILPNFKKFIERNAFTSLATSYPPQSPVAWSNFITGTNAGSHGIFDFLHRDPSTFTPYFSTSHIDEPSKTIKLGNLNVPLKAGKIELLRKGQAFWTLLEENHVPVDMFKMPANFPPVDCQSNTISGMGTPDLLGTYGTFSYFTDSPPDNADTFTGGIVYPVELSDHQVKTALQGPANPFLNNVENTSADFHVYRDPVHSVIKIVIQGKEIILNQGEWSDWIHVRFEMLPNIKSVSGICRFYAQQVHPQFRLYATPINIDPSDPAMPISTPPDYAKQLHEAVGPFYTQGFPEDTKTLSNRIFTDEEYLQQAKLVLEERKNIFDYKINSFKEGFFFYYISSIDQNSHMMLRTMDKRHPLYEPKASPEVKNAMRYLYREMDTLLAKTLSKVDSRTLFMIVSDHGFAPFYKEIHLSSWLLEKGYTGLYDPSVRGQTEFYENMDWNQTAAYALGLNGLYLNLRGREINGIVEPSRYEQIRNKLKAELEAARDPETGQRIISGAYKPEEIYSGPYIKNAPDLIIGYRPGYRISDKAAIGTFPQKTIEIRSDKWSADHCMDPLSVPGVLLTNREIVKDRPALDDMASVILDAFKISAGSRAKKPVLNI